MGLEEASSDEARRVAERALASGQADDALAATQGRLLDPVPIRSPGGGAAGWIVPIGLGGTLLGYVQLDERCRFHRYASFRRSTGTKAEGPTIAEWLDAVTITKRAHTHAEPGETFSAPELTYDRSPDRLAWAVRATRPDGGQRTIYVAGTAVWEPRRPP